VPAVEARVVAIVFGADGGVVEGAVVWVLQRNFLEALVLGDGPVADDLDFGLVGDCFEVRVQDRAFGIEGLAVPVAAGGGVKEAG
jgi:hypothetical protein